MTLVSHPRAAAFELFLHLVLHDSVVLRLVQQHGTSLICKSDCENATVSLGHYYVRWLWECYRKFGRAYLPHRVAILRLPLPRCSLRSLREFQIQLRTRPSAGARLGRRVFRICARCYWDRSIVLRSPLLRASGVRTLIGATVHCTTSTCQLCMRTMGGRGKVPHRVPPCRTAFRHRFCGQL